MRGHLFYKAKAALLGVVFMTSISSVYQQAHADDSWFSLLVKPLVESVIIPTINSSMNKLEANMANTRKQQSTPVNSSMQGSQESNVTPEWKLPDEPVN